MVGGGWREVVTGPWRQEDMKGLEELSKNQGRKGPSWRQRKSRWQKSFFLEDNRV